MNVKIVKFKISKNEIVRSLYYSPNKIPDSSNKVAILIPGFERNPLEPVLIQCMDLLISNGYVSYIPDLYGGMGLSELDFENLTIKRMTNHLNIMVDSIKKKHKTTNVLLVGHSLSACVIVEFLNNYQANASIVKKIILFRPALNQKKLVRYWFTRSYMKKLDKELLVTIDNYLKYFNKKGFDQYLKAKNMAKSHYISNKYLVESASNNYEKRLSIYKGKIKVITGDSDLTVPKSTVDKEYKAFVVKKGDHDLCRPDMVSEWYNVVKKFVFE